jgi:hypothetical protein
MKINMHKPDSHWAGFSNGVPGDVPPHPLDDVVSNPQSGSILEMQTGLFHLGRNRALQSGTTQPRPDDIRTLEDHARAMAKDTYRDRYDPAQNVHDAMHQAEYERNLARREEAEETEQHAAANLRDAELRLSRVPKAGPKPVAHPLLTAAFIVAIMLTVAPTLHDSVFHTLPDDMLVWFLALLSAAFVGAMLTFAILHGRHTKWIWIGVAAGMVLGLGLGVVRLSSAEGVGEAMFAAGLTLMEIAAVWLLEWLASGLRTHEAEWLVRHNVETEALSCRDAAQVDLTRRQTRVQELSQAIADTIAFVENRHNRNIHIAELEAVAIKAVSDGYNAGIAENIGRIRGVNRRSE